MFCRKCGFQFGDDDRFCPSCGTEVIEKTNITEKAPAEAPADVPADVTAETVPAAPAKKKSKMPLVALLAAALVLVVVAVIFLGGSKCIFENYDWDITKAEALKKVEAKGLTNSAKNDSSILYFEDNFWGANGGRAAVVLNFEDTDDSLDRVSVLVAFDSKLECSNAFDIYKKKMFKLHGEPTITNGDEKFVWKTDGGIAELIVADTLCAVGYFQDESVYED